jgi:hypothetical protein
MTRRKLDFPQKGLEMPIFVLLSPGHLFGSLVLLKCSPACSAILDFSFLSRLVSSLQNEESAIYTSYIYMDLHHTTFVYD